MDCCGDFIIAMRMPDGIDLELRDLGSLFGLLVFFVSFSKTTPDLRKLILGSQFFWIR
jgi:hypothetical protein